MASKELKIRILIIFKGMTKYKIRILLLQFQFCLKLLYQLLHKMISILMHGIKWHVI